MLYFTKFNIVTKLNKLLSDFLHRFFLTFFLNRLFPPKN